MKVQFSTHLCLGFSEQGNSVGIKFNETFKAWASLTNMTEELF